MRRSMEHAQGDNKPTVLMVDDSAVMRRAAEKMLGSEFDVVVAEDGEQGWDAIEHNKSIQVVFTDLNMPVMDGYELLERVRTSSDSGIRNLPLIVVTVAENDDEARERALEAGATDFITKPFNSHEIKARAQAHSDYQRTTQVLSQQASLDPVTQTLTEEGFMQALERDLGFCSRHHEVHSVMLIELYGFRELFMKIGRRGADTILGHLSKVLAQSLRKEDTVGRVGLARFAISMPAIPSHGVESLAQRLISVVSAFRAKLRGEPLQIAVAVGGYTVSQPAGEELATIWRCADAVLERALQAGANQLCVEQSSSDQQEGEANPLQADEQQTFARLFDQLSHGNEAAAKALLPEALSQFETLIPLMEASDRERLCGLLSQS